jgi:hypothetical protein
MHKHHYLKRQVIRGDGKLIGKAERIGWDDVALPAEVREGLERNIVDVLRRRRVFRQNGIPQKRGVLLHGPPGTTIVEPQKCFILKGARVPCQSIKASMVAQSHA